MAGTFVPTLPKDHHQPSPDTHSKHSWNERSLAKELRRTVRPATLWEQKGVAPYRRATGGTPPSARSSLHAANRSRG